MEFKKNSWICFTINEIPTNVEISRAKINSKESIRPARQTKPEECLVELNSRLAQYQNKVLPTFRRSWSLVNRQPRLGGWAGWRNAEELSPPPTFPRPNCYFS